MQSRKASGECSQWPPHGAADRHGDLAWQHQLWGQRSRAAPSKHAWGEWAQGSPAPAGPRQCCHAWTALWPQWACLHGFTPRQDFRLGSSPIQAQRPEHAAFPRARQRALLSEQRCWVLDGRTSLMGRLLPLCNTALYKSVALWNC